MAAIYSNFFGGSITDNPLTFTATTINCATLAAFPAVASPDYAWLTLDPTGVNGNPEIVKVTAHTTGATSVTVARGQQFTTARQHILGTKIVQSLTTTDVANMTNRIIDVTANKPAASVSLSGVDFWATDTNTLWTCDGTGWIIVREPFQSYNASYTSSVAPNPGIGSTGTITSRYQRSWGKIYIHYQVQYNGTGITASGGAWLLSMPVNGAGTPYESHITGWYYNATGFSTLIGDTSNINTIRLIGNPVNAFAVPFLISNTFPGPNPPVAGNVLQVSGEYTMSSPYS